MESRLRSVVRATSIAGKLRSCKIAQKSEKSDFFRDLCGRNQKFFCFDADLYVEMKLTEKKDLF